MAKNLEVLYGVAFSIQVGILRLSVASGVPSRSLLQRTPGGQWMPGLEIKLLLAVMIMLSEHIIHEAQPSIDALLELVELLI
ncbi:hypothetical protein Nepgr_017576 [Nepenthes gracilis]|uniref:Uncharacterized protein n=1 Tax=Nepenthes gracilis TaxID=150966 RepID=A0AAD3XTH0_NEPGR|nr:hypothetical protein Nepgr_017576 [Nepenthes gracilis]